LSTLQALGRTKHYELAPGLSRRLQKWRILNRQIRLKNSRKITLRRRRRANLRDSPATYQNISAESGI
jgi:hypothetical protein